MKLHQPTTTATIYFILQGDNPKDIPVNIAFDDESAAIAYLGRFKTLGDAEMVTCQLNPGFYTDINRDCFLIKLNQQNNSYLISLVNDLERSNLAMAGHYFYEGDDICIYVMATSPEEALKLARDISGKVGEMSSDVP